MVIDHNDVEADLPGGLEGIHRRGAAVEGDDELSPVLLQRPEHSGTGPIALGDPVRDVDRNLAAHGAHPAHHLSGAGGAIDVVVGEDHHRSAPRERIDQNFRRSVHIPEGGRVGELSLEGGVEIDLALLRPHSP